jgi:ankyrin repeat protein
MRVKQGLIFPVVFVLFGGCATARFSPINDAVLKGDLNKVRAIIESEPNSINTADEGGQTPLHYASGEGHIDIVRFLVSKGVDVNVRDDEGDTPLHYVADSGHTEIAKLLVSSGADVNVKSFYLNQTPLHPQPIKVISRSPNI